MGHALLILWLLEASLSVGLQATASCAGLPMVIEEVNLSPNYFAPGKSTSLSVSAEYSNSYEGWTQYYITSLELTLATSTQTSSPAFLTVDQEVPIDTYLEVQGEVTLGIEGWQDGQAELSVVLNGAQGVAGCYQRTVRIGDSGSAWLAISVLGVLLVH